MAEEDYNEVDEAGCKKVHKLSVYVLMLTGDEGDETWQVGLPEAQTFTVPASQWWKA